MDDLNSNQRQDALQREQRSQSLIEASKKLFKEKIALRDASFGFQEIQRQMDNEWNEWKRWEPGREAEFPAEAYIIQLEQALLKFVDIFRASNYQENLLAVDWDAYPREYDLGIGQEDAKLSFDNALEIVRLALGHEQFSSRIREGWTSDDLVLDGLAGFRNSPTYIRFILLILARYETNYPRVAFSTEAVTNAINRLKSRFESPEPWDAKRLADYRFCESILKEEWIRLQVPFEMPSLNPNESAELAIPKLEEIDWALSLGEYEDFEDDETHDGNEGEDLESVVEPDVGEGVESGAVIEKRTEEGEVDAKTQVDSDGLPAVLSGKPMEVAELFEMFKDCVGSKNTLSKALERLREKEIEGLYPKRTEGDRRVRMANYLYYPAVVIPLLNELYRS